MAAKATSIYISIATKGDPFDVKVKKRFFVAKEANIWLKDVTNAETGLYPLDKFRVTKETY